MQLFKCLGLVCFVLFVCFVVFSYLFFRVFIVVVVVIVVVFWFVFRNNKNTFIQPGHIKLIKNDNRGFNIVSKDL